jgi:lambda family phage tail tape measure protein
MAKFASTVQFQVQAETKNVAVLDDFRKRVDGIGRAAGQSTTGIGALSTGLSGLSRSLGVLGIGLSVASIVGFGSRVVGLAGQLTDASAATTVAATTLDQYRQAGEQVGVSFETITGGLGKLNKSIAEAASGNQEAADAFGQLGISVKNQDGSIRSTSEVFQELADKVKAAPNDAAIFEQGTKIMGRGFANLLPLLEQGNEGMTKFRSHFTPEGVQQLDDFGDKLNRAGEGFTALGVAIAQEAIPPLTEFLKVLNNAMTGLGLLERQNFDTPAELASRFKGGDIGQRLEELKKIRDQENKSSPSISQIYKDQQAAIKEAAAAAKEAARERKRLLDEEARAMERIAQDRQRELERQQSILSDFTRQNQSRLDDLRLEIDLVGKSYKEQEKILLLRQLDNEARERGLDLTAENRALLAAETEAAKENITRALDDLNTKRQSLSTGIESGLSDYLADVEDRASAARDAVGNSLRGIEDAFVNLATTGKLSFKELTNSIIADIARIAARQAITAPLAGLLSSAFSGGFSAAPAAGGLSGLPSASLPGVNFAMGGIMSSQGSMPLNKYSTGGIANSPQLALFGEGRTPEAFVPLPDGRRIPVNLKGGGGGGTVVNVTVNMADGSQSTTSNGAGAQELGKAIAAAVRSEIINQKRPGGMLS